MPPTLIESAVTPRTVPLASVGRVGPPLVEAELQAVARSRAAAAVARVRIVLDTVGHPSVG
ncbi:hypothetical protein GCM10019017_16280 [Streptomyces showdoensis]